MRDKLDKILIDMEDTLIELDIEINHPGNKERIVLECEKSLEIIKSMELVLIKTITKLKE